MKIAIMAGTPVDVQFGTHFFGKKIKDAEFYKVPISKTPREQTDFQMQSPQAIHQYVKEKLLMLKNDGVKITIIYCNSLSSVLDLKKLSNETDITIITPLTAYEKIASLYSKVGLISANSISLHNITTLLEDVNPEIMVNGFCSLAIIEAIETGKKPNKIIEQFGLREVISAFSKSGVQKIILGCTHFDYLEEELKMRTNTLINPSEFMVDEVMKFIEDLSIS